MNLLTIAETAQKSELSYKIGVCFLLLVTICVPPIIIELIFNINAVVLILIIC